MNHPLHAKPVTAEHSVAALQGRILKAGLAFMALLIVGAGVAGATGWQPRQGCSYTVQTGDTLTAISEATGTPIRDVVASTPHVVDPDRIIAGDTIDVCTVDVVQPRHGTLTPGRLVEWAQAVNDTRPDWATDADARFLTAVSGPESGHCTHLWNPGDASANGKWTGSYGCIQIRVLANPAAFPNDSFRDLQWLKQSFDNQAEAAWIVLGQDRDHAAWGPYRDGKLPGPTCRGSSNVDRCLTWWAQADAAIGYINLPTVGAP